MKNKGKISGASGLLLLLLLLAWQFLIKPQEQQTQSPSAEPVVVQQEQKVEKSSVKHDVAEVALADPPRFEKIAVEDIRSVDGDTFAFRSRGKNFRLRLLMVDTPESVKEGMAVQPFGKEASHFTQEQLAKGNVSIVFDKGAVKDKYDRYLAYVYVGEQMLQEELLKNGLGIVRYVDAGGDSYLQELLAAQKQAEVNKTGVWSVEDYVYRTKTSYYRYNEK